MAKLFYFSDILNFAVEREKESVQLYQDLAKRAPTEESKALFLRLVGEEERHEAFYEGMLGALTESEAHKQLLDWDEYMSYMRELINSHRTAFLSADLSNLPKVLDYAIEREKDSILFYAGLKNLVAPNMRENVEAILRQEATHVVLLNQFKQEL